jgi:hypothetical protein
MKASAILRKIIWKKKSRWELAIAGVGFFLGLAIFLVSAHVFLDLDTILNKRLSQGQMPDFLVVSKHIGGNKGNGGAGFSDAEIESLGKKRFVLDVGKMLTNDFDVEAEVSIFNKGFRTMLFFEAVPDRFLDEIPAGWAHPETEAVLPVMVSRDFLLLYNFGFAQSHNFPLLTEDLLRLVPVSLTIRGNGIEKRIPARIAGTSDRITSILIPYGIMESLNKQFGTGIARTPLRLVLSVKDRTDPQIKSYFEENGYETSKEKLRLSDVGFTVRTIMSVVGVIGMILIVLSFTIFLTTFRLIISRNSAEIGLLLDLGYSVKMIARSSMRALIVYFTAITLAVGVAVWISVSIERGFLLSNGFTGFGYFVHPEIPVLGIGIVLGSAILNYVSLVFSISRRSEY